MRASLGHRSSNSPATSRNTLTPHRDPNPTTPHYGNLNPTTRET
jgi:hypothetical protein